MSRDTDPCYCEQAQEYEALLERVYVVLECEDGGVSAMLASEIRETLDRYKAAQAEYDE